VQLGDDGLSNQRAARDGLCSPVTIVLVLVPVLVPVPRIIVVGPVVIVFLVVLVVLGLVLVLRCGWLIFWGIVW
jgi:hypothetical protein